MIQCPPRFSQMAVCLPVTSVFFPSFSWMMPWKVLLVQAMFPRFVTFRSSFGWVESPSGDVLLTTFRLESEARIRTWPRRRHRYRLLLNHASQVADRGLQLRILPVESGVRKIIHHHVGIDAMAFDQPLAIGAVHAILR